MLQTQLKKSVRNKKTRELASFSLSSIGRSYVQSPEQNATAEKENRKDALGAIVTDLTATEKKTHKTEQFPSSYLNRGAVQNYGGEPWLELEPFCQSKIGLCSGSRIKTIFPI